MKEEISNKSLSHKVTFNINFETGGKSITQIHYGVLCDEQILWTDNEKALGKNPLARLRYIEAHFKNSLVASARRVWEESQLIQSVANGSNQEERQWASEAVAGYIEHWCRIDEDKLKQVKERLGYGRGGSETKYDEYDKDEFLRFREQFYPLWKTAIKIYKGIQKKSSKNVRNRWREIMKASGSVSGLPNHLLEKLDTTNPEYDSYEATAANLSLLHAAWLSTKSIHDLKLAQLKRIYRDAKAGDAKKFGLSKLG